MTDRVETLKALVERWRAESGSWEPGIGSGIGMCADELDALIAAGLSEAPQEDVNRLLNIGATDTVSVFLAEAVMWAKCDLSQHGEGPSGGFRARYEKAEAAHEAWLNRLGGLSEAPAPQEKQPDARAQGDAMAVDFLKKFPDARADRNHLGAWFHSAMQVGAEMVEADDAWGQKSSILRASLPTEMTEGGTLVCTCRHDSGSSTNCAIHSPAAPPAPTAELHRYTITSEGASLGYFRLVEDKEGAWVTWAEVEALLKASRPAAPPERVSEGKAWSAVWPDKPGIYWFHGRRSRHAKEIALHICEVRGPNASGRVFYVSGGAFLYAEEGAEGVWMPIPLPIEPAARPAVEPREEP